MNYKTGDVEQELNILDDSTVNNRVLTAFEFNRCFSHSCIKCYHGNYWIPSGRGRPPSGTRVAQLSKGWTTWREQVLVSAVNVGCCDKARWELVQFSAKSKHCWSPPEVRFWAAGHMPFVCMMEQPLMRRYITMILLNLITSSTKQLCLGDSKVISENSDTLMAYFELVKANTTSTRGREPDELYGYLFSLTYAVSSCHFVNKDVAPITWKHIKGGMTLVCSTNTCFVIL